MASAVGRAAWLSIVGGSACLAAEADGGPPPTFDLQCAGDGSGQAIDYVLPAAKTAPWTVTVHVDMRQRLYCLDDCTESLAILAVTPHELVLNKPVRYEPEETIYTRVSRTSGILTKRVRSSSILGGRTTEYHAQCKLGPLTASPKRLF